MLEKNNVKSGDKIVFHKKPKIGLKWYSTDYSVVKSTNSKIEGGSDNQYEKPKDGIICLSKEYTVLKVLNYRRAWDSIQHLKIKGENEEEIMFVSCRRKNYKVLISDDELTRTYLRMNWIAAYYYILNDITSTISLLNRFPKEFNVNEVFEEVVLNLSRLKKIGKQNDTGFFGTLNSCLQNKAYYANKVWCEGNEDIAWIHLNKIIKVGLQNNFEFHDMRMHLGLELEHDKIQEDSYDTFDEERAIMDAFRNGNQDLWGY